MRKSLSRWAYRVAYYGGIAGLCHAAIVGDAEWASNLLPFLFALILLWDFMVAIGIGFVDAGAVASIDQSKLTPLWVVVCYHLALALALAADGRYVTATMAALFMLTSTLGRAALDERAKVLSEMEASNG